MGFLAGKAHPDHSACCRTVRSPTASPGACRAQGAELAFTYQNDRFKDRVTEMAAEFGSSLVFPCDVAEDAQIDALFAALREPAGTASTALVHAIAFAPREAISGDFLDGISREAFRIAHDISAYSFPALAKAALPMMEGRRGAMLTLTYLGAVRMRAQLQHDGARQGQPRGQRALPGRERWARAASASTASRPVRSRRWRLRHQGLLEDPRASSSSNSPLRRNVTIEDVGNVAAFLLSDLAAGVTAEITYVDGGFSNVMGGAPGGVDSL